MWGWRTQRKIIVIESDDWGSIRMPSRETYEACLTAGYRVDLNFYEKYDSLASEQDLELMFELLASYRDKHNQHPVITANVLATNPSFEKIEKSGFSEYHFEPVTDTFKRYPHHTGVFELWKTGMQDRLFFPQSHGREHLNVSMFMNALRRGDSDALFGFKNRMPGSIPHGVNEGNRYVEVLNFNDRKDKESKLETLLEGLDLFEELFGYRSKSFAPPNYIWSPDFDNPVSEMGVRYYQGRRIMREPLTDYKYLCHKYKLGEINEFGQRYLVRNAFFEPTLVRSDVKDPVSDCLREISIAFLMRKPAIICSHRINYVGYIDEKNRDVNLRHFKTLLDTIVKKWPEVEFMTSVQLGDLINNDVA